MSNGIAILRLNGIAISPLEVNRTFLAAHGILVLFTLCRNIGHMIGADIDCHYKQGVFCFAGATLALKFGYSEKATKI